MKYLLPCSCGKSVPIEVSQAGQTVHCDCGATLDVPPLRHLRQLPTATEKVAVKPPRSWSPAARILFALGLGIAGFGLLRATYFQWNRSTLDTEEVAWDQTLDSDINNLTNMNLDQAWNNWLSVRDNDIGPYRPPNFIISRRISSWMQERAAYGLGLALAGLVMIGIAFVLPRSTPARGRPPARR